ncbi:Uma2 family endonuclease [Dolichospermum sp. UHCC 0259]|uniref:Uma2 family endonuclease n=1 Tax=Dolichospermum sp. UHCC 0259 TaxID=2590010 RepID=UPI001445265A|nr:Uma2 family endonuclease [Dolichospermum sp. UHCC 0259]MTJ46666.1 Uma2 family endonuclease [Dolichospermum sp. UHCC 0259]
MVIKKPDINNIPQNLILPLESGDRLSRHEFERRYTESLHVKKAELIEGVVYVASPLRFQRHAEPHSNLIGWLWNYRISTPGVKLGIEPTIRLDQDNEPQPDGILFIDQSLGGKSRITADDYIEGSPELVAEIAASSAAYDLHDKKKAYRRNGIQEYIVWQSLEKKLNWFQLHESEYISLEPDADGVIKSQVMPGLWLAVSALLTGDMTQVLAVVQAGLNSPEHAEFLQNR